MRHIIDRTEHGSPVFYTDSDQPLFVAMLPTRAKGKLTVAIMGPGLKVTKENTVVMTPEVAAKFRDFLNKHFPVQS